MFEVLRINSLLIGVSEKANVFFYCYMTKRNINHDLNIEVVLITTTNKKSSLSMRVTKQFIMMKEYGRILVKNIGLNFKNFMMHKLF